LSKHFREAVSPIFERFREQWDNLVLTCSIVYHLSTILQSIIHHPGYSSLKSAYLRGVTISFQDDFTKAQLHKPTIRSGAVIHTTYFTTLRSLQNESAKPPTVGQQSANGRLHLLPPRQPTVPIAPAQGWCKRCMRLCRSTPSGCWFHAFSMIEDLKICKRM